MKKYLSLACVSIFLGGCASTAFNHAQQNANLVKNGMSIQQAVDIIGMPPTSQSATGIEWQRGHVQTYDATPDGAVSFHVKDGIIVDVPEGGIFGPEARRQFLAAWAAQYDRQAAQRRKQTEEQARAAAAASNRREAERAAHAAQVRAEIAAEAQAAADAKVACNVKSSCAKVFALAQIYVATETDQKIQVVTDSVIQTYNPTEIGHVGASIIKMPGRGDNAEVSLSLSCKTGDDDVGGSRCRSKDTRLYQEFKPFIEARLVQ